MTNKLPVTLHQSLRVLKAARAVRDATHDFLPDAQAEYHRICMAVGFLEFRITQLCEALKIDPATLRI